MRTSPPARAARSATSMSVVKESPAAPTPGRAGWPPRSRRRSGSGTPPARSAAGSARLQDVDRAEHEDPHDVDEVPVDARHLDAAVLLGRVVTPERADRREQQQGEPDEDVGPVQPRQPIEDRALRIVGRGEAQVDVFVYLDREE